MQTFDQSILSLLNKGFISYDEALRQSSNPADFELKVKGVVSTSDTEWEGFEGDAETNSDEDAEEEKIHGDTDDIERF